jgi:hypothetical protein
MSEEMDGSEHWNVAQKLLFLASEMYLDAVGADAPDQEFREETGREMFALIEQLDEEAGDYDIDVPFVLTNNGKRKRIILKLNIQTEDF